MSTRPGHLKTTLAALCLLALAATGIAAAAVPVGLSVTITDGVDEVGPNTDVVYTTELINAGTDPVDAVIVVTVPGYVTIAEAKNATLDGDDASWTVTVAPGASAKVSAPARIGAIPKGQLRVTTLVSVYLGDTAGPPVIRSADADRIRGVADRPAGTKATITPVVQKPFWQPPLLLIVGGTILVLLLAGAITWTVIRSRRPSIGVRRRTQP